MVLQRSDAAVKTCSFLLQQRGHFFVRDAVVASDLFLLQTRGLMIIYRWPLILQLCSVRARALFFCNVGGM